MYSPPVREWLGCSCVPNEAEQPCAFLAECPIRSQHRRTTASLDRFVVPNAIERPAFEPRDAFPRGETHHQHKSPARDPKSVVKGNAFNSAKLTSPRMGMDGSRLPNLNRSDGDRIGFLLISSAKRFCCLKSMRKDAGKQVVSQKLIGASRWIV